jgi:LysM repeat protein
MKQILIVAIPLLLFATLIANSQTKMSRNEYIDAYKVLAINEMHRSGIPASIKMAQACLESGNGNSSLARKSNNHFGIKCRNDWKGARVYHNDDEVNECFRKYPTVVDSYIDHTNFLTSNSRYSGLFKLNPTDYKAWAHGLKEAGYATNPRYAHLLIKLIEDEKLYLFDQITTDQLVNFDLNDERGKKFEQETTRKHLTKAKDKITESFGNVTLNPFATREVLKINELDAVNAKPGDTYESIAREFNLKLWEIHLFNDLPRDTYQPAPGELVYLQRKRYSATKEFETHTVRSGESMWSISQKYGLRVNRLFRLNRIKGTETPNVGDELYLRKKSPND